jgi:UDP-N-acetylglucosamine 2-epimerase (non-hydrolysing)
LHIPIAHIEAGMRSFNKKMPEEINRVVTDHISDIQFCSTKTAIKNLKNENIRRHVYMVGDIMVDSLKQWYIVAKRKSQILQKLSLQPKKYFLSTVHRAENTELAKNLDIIFKTLLQIHQPIIAPLHPRTWKMIPPALWDKIQKSKYLRVIKPVGYLDMLILQKNAKKILTDSGGIQKEAYVLKTPCITLRNETEWVESLKGGWNQLTGANQSKIMHAINSHPNPKTHRAIFGHGDTAKRITRILYEYCRV